MTAAPQLVRSKSALCRKSPSSDQCDRQSTLVPPAREPGAVSRRRGGRRSKLTAMSPQLGQVGPKGGAHPLSRSPGELLDQLTRFLVAVLNGRALHEVRGRAEQRTTDAAVLGDFAAAEGVDDHAGRVGGIPHLELELDVEGHVTEVAALDPDVGPLAIVEPRHMVARADVDVVVGDALVDLAGDRLRL